MKGTEAMPMIYRDYDISKVGRYTLCDQIQNQTYNDDTSEKWGQ